MGAEFDSKKIIHSEIQDGGSPKYFNYEKCSDFRDISYLGVLKGAEFDSQVKKKICLQQKLWKLSKSCGQL